VRRLQKLLGDIDPGNEILGAVSSIESAVEWLIAHPAPDVILMDINLADGSSFDIFQKVDITSPVIFATAYDEYAMHAFKVNCIDYLLKPIKMEEMKRAIDKFKKWTRQDVMRYLSQLYQLTPAPGFNDRILLPFKDKLMPVNMKDISCFYTTSKNTSIFLKNGTSYSYSKTLEQIEATLNPSEFIRANKQFIIARNSVKNITIWFDNRLLITLDIEPPERIYVSKNKAAEFKAWIVKNN
jgi:DNA-binding LytR/AlgR family response regulator